MNLPNDCGNYDLTYTLKECETTAWKSVRIDQTDN